MKKFPFYKNNTLLKLMPPNDIEIKFDFDYYETNIFYFYNDLYQFSYHKKSNSLNIDRELFEKIPLDALPDFMKKYFDIYYERIHSNSIYVCDKINDRFNIVNL